MLESDQYKRNLERLGAKINTQRDICSFLVSYIPQTMNDIITSVSQSLFSLCLPKENF